MFVFLFGFFHRKFLPLFFLANVPQPPAFNAHAGSSRSREKKPCTDMQHFTLVKCFGNQPKSTDFVADKGGLWWPLCNTLR